MDTTNSRLWRDAVLNVPTDYCVTLGATIIAELVSKETRASLKKELSAIAAEIQDTKLYSKITTSARTHMLALYLLFKEPKLDESKIKQRDLR